MLCLANWLDLFVFTFGLGFRVWTHGSVAWKWIMCAQLTIHRFTMWVKTSPTTIIPFSALSSFHFYRSLRTKCTFHASVELNECTMCVSVIWRAGLFVWEKRKTFCFIAIFRRVWRVLDGFDGCARIAHSCENFTYCDIAKRFCILSQSQFSRLNNYHLCAWKRLHQPCSLWRERFYGKQSSVSSLLSVSFHLEKKEQLSRDSVKL